MDDRMDFSWFVIRYKNPGLVLLPSEHQLYAKNLLAVLSQGFFFFFF